MPEEKRRAETSCVLPQPPWPTRATFRMLALSYTFIALSLPQAGHLRQGHGVSKPSAEVRWRLSEAHHITRFVRVQSSKFQVHTKSGQSGESGKSGRLG